VTLKPLPPPPAGVADDPSIHNPLVRRLGSEGPLPCCASFVGARQLTPARARRSGWSGWARAGWAPSSSGRASSWRTRRRSTRRCVAFFCVVVGRRQRAR
jgi:hypothetical protein